MNFINDSKSAAELLFDNKHQLFLNFNDHTDQAKNSINYLNDKLNTFVEEFAFQINF